jgi:hypothetical protein
VRVAPESAESRGLEFSASGALGAAWHYWGSYTWSRVSDEIADADVPRSWDQRSALNAGLGWQRGEYALSGTLRYHSGWPVTPATVLPRSAAADAWLALAARNSARRADYVGLDLRASWTRPFGANELEVFAEISNATNRANACCATLATSAPTSAGSLNPGYWMPRAYNIGLTWTVH